MVQKSLDVVVVAYDAYRGDVTKDFEYGSSFYVFFIYHHHITTCFPKLKQ